MDLQDSRIGTCSSDTYEGRTVSAAAIVGHAGPLQRTASVAVLW